MTPKHDALAELAAADPRIKEIHSRASALWHNQAEFDPQGLCDSEKARELGQCQETEHFGPHCPDCMYLLTRLAEAHARLHNLRTDLQRIADGVIGPEIAAKSALYRDAAKPKEGDRRKGTVN